MANFRRKHSWRYPKHMSLSRSHLRRFGNHGLKSGERFKGSDMRRLLAARQEQQQVG